MSQEENFLLLINNCNIVIQEGSAAEVIEFPFKDVLNMNWGEHQPNSRLNDLTEYFREQKTTNGDFKYFALAAHYDDKARKAVFNFQLSKQLMERLCSALSHPFIVFSGPLESQLDAGPGSPIAIAKGGINARLNLRALITAETWRDNRDFYNAAFVAPLISVASNVVLNGFQFANLGVVSTIRRDQQGFPLASRPALAIPIPTNPTTPTKVSGCRVRFNLSVGWKEPPQIKNIQISSQHFMEKLFGDEATKDLTIVAGNGAEIKCHTIVFSAHCPVFSRMLSSQTSMTEAISRRFEMSENSEVGVRTLIKYLYGMPMLIEDMSADVAVELVQTAHKYDLTHLEGALLHLCMEVELNSFTADAILELYMFVKKFDSLKDLRERCLLLMTSMDMKEFRACEEFKKLDSLQSADVFVEMLEWYKKRVPKADERGVKRKGDEAQ